MITVNKHALLITVICRKYKYNCNTILAVLSILTSNKGGENFKMSVEEDTELRDLVAQTLENNGVLGKIRVHMIFLTLCYISYIKMLTHENI